MFAAKCKVESSYVCKFEFNLIATIMKKLLVIAVITLFSVAATAQNSFDNIYQKYRGKSGFTSMSMGNELLRFAAAMDPEDEELQDLPNKIRGLRLLVSDKASQNFTDDINDAIEAGGYLNIMEVVDGDDVVKFYAKPGASEYCSFAMHVYSDDGEQVILTIEGDLTTSDLAKLGQNKDDDDYLSLLRKLEKN